MALLVYSPKCAHSVETLEFINGRDQLRAIVRLHDVNQLGFTQITKQRKKNSKLGRLNFTVSKDRLSLRLHSLSKLMKIMSTYS